MDRIIRHRGALVLLAAALVLTGLSGATAAKKRVLTQKKADALYVNVGEKASDANLLDGTDSAGFLGANETAADTELLDGTDSSGFLGANETAADSELFGGQAPADFQSAGIADLRAYCALLEELGNYAPCSPFVTITDNTGAIDAGIAIGTDGYPVISVRSSGADLQVVKCNDHACKGGDEAVNTVDDTANQLSDTSIVIARDGRPMMSYYEAGTAGALRVARCDDPACEAPGETAIPVDDPANDVGQFSSIAISSNGNPAVSYHDATDGTLKFLQCGSLTCGGPEINVVDDPANTVGQHTSLAMGTDGFPVMSYYDVTAGSLKVAHCDDLECDPGGNTTTTVDASANDVGKHSSLTIGSDGMPVISYFDDSEDALKVAKCNDLACEGGNETVTTVANGANSFGERSSIAVGTDGSPVISHLALVPNRLEVVDCNDLACQGGNESTVIADTTGGNQTSLAIGIDGIPVVVHGATANGLRVVRVTGGS